MNYRGQFVALVLFLVVIGIFLFGYVSYSNVSKELRYVTSDVKFAFYRGVEDIYRLKYIDTLGEGDWNSICSATDHCCFILDNFDFKTLSSNSKVSKAEFDNIEKAVKDYFHELNDFLSNADFDNLTTEQRNYLAVVGDKIHRTLGNYNSDFFPTLYEFIKD